MDDINRRIVNKFQGGFPISERPYADAAAQIGIEEADMIERLEGLLEAGTLTRFGPLFNAEAMGGGLSLAAMAVPVDRFDAVAASVNAHAEVAHNYAREHDLNMWFVLATEDPERISGVIAEIEEETGLKVYDMPKSEEFFVGLHFEL